MEVSHGGIGSRQGGIGYRGCLWHWPGDFADLCAEGAKVAVSDLNVEGCEETVAMIRKAGGEAFSVKCDVFQD